MNVNYTMKILIMTTFKPNNNFNNYTVLMSNLQIQSQVTEVK